MFMTILLLVFVLGLMVQGIKLSVNYLFNAAEELTGHTLISSDSQVNLLSVPRYEQNQRQPGSIVFTSSKRIDHNPSAFGRSDTSQLQKPNQDKEVFMRTSFHQTA
jgi:hypothetical protein